MAHWQLTPPKLVIMNLILKQFSSNHIYLLTTKSSYIMKKIILLLLFALQIPESYSQIFSGKVQPSPFPVEINLNQSPYIAELSDESKKELFLQDSIAYRLGNPPRFGKNIDASIDVIQEGKHYTLGEKIFTYYEIKAPKAFSVSLLIEKIKIGPDSELNFYNLDRSYRFGPITPDVIPKKGRMGTDLIPGEHIVVELIRNKQYEHENELLISSIIYGYNTPLWFSGYGNAQLPCHNDVKCPIGNDWQGEADGVARYPPDELRLV